MNRFASRPFVGLSRPFFGIAIALLLSLGFSPVEVSPHVSVLPISRHLTLHPAKVARVGVVRTTSAAGLDGELDTVADLVYGQDDFETGTSQSASTGFNQPAALFVYDTGQIFVADTEHNRVLGWNSVDNYQIGDPADLVLGQANFVSASAPNPPSAASMNHPGGITLGADGILYVSDSGNHRVLVFLPLNLCDYYKYYDDFWCIEADDYQFPANYVPVFESSTAADYALGQPDMTTSSPQPTWYNTLNNPMGLVTDVNDNLVVADQGNNRVLIYEWPYATGMLAKWIVGQGPNSGDSFGSLHAAPNPPTASSMNGPTAVAVGTTANELYISDTGNNRILVFNNRPIDAIADGVIGQPDFVSNSPNQGGLSATSLNGPTGLKMDAGNRLFVADTQNNRVLLFDRTTSDAQADGVFGQPNFTSNTANNGGLNAASLSTPTGIATDASFMDVYIADQGNNRVLQYFEPLQNPTPVIAELEPGTVRAGHVGFTLNVWGTGIISSTIVEVNGVTRKSGSKFLGLAAIPIGASEVATTGQLTVTLRNPLPGGGISDPFILSVYAPIAGDYLPDSVIGQKGFASDSGPFSRLDAATLFGPGGVVVDPHSGRLFVADTSNGRVLSWPSASAQADGQKADLVIGEPDFETVALDTYVAERTTFGPTGLALDSQGNLYVIDARTNRVLIFRAPFSSGMAAALIIQDSGDLKVECQTLCNPLALALDSQDNLYLLDSFYHRVLFYQTPLTSGDTVPDKVIGQANFTSHAPNRGGAVSASGFNFPSGLVIDGADNLYVADSQNHRILIFLNPAGTDAIADRVIGQGGSFTTGVANSGGLSASSLNYPYGLALDGAGNLFVADSDNSRVLRFDAPLASDAVADGVYGQNGSFTTSQPQIDPSQGNLNQPVAVGLGADGDLFVADTGNNRVLAFRGVGSPQGNSNIYLPSVIK